MNAKTIIRVSIATVAIMAGSACHDDPMAVDVPLAGDRAVGESPTAAQQRSSAPSDDVVKYTASDFADALRDINNENEVLVWVKSASDARPDSSLFRGQGSDVSVVGVPGSPPGGTRRTDLRLNRATANAAKTTVGQVLAPHGATVTWVAAVMPVMAVRLPDVNLDTALAELFGHDNVDWLEANQRRPVKPIADPVGNNPFDSKHTTHFVGGAWDHTRGTGAKLGILDSGMAGKVATETYHPDLQENPTSGGVFPLGFVDDGGDCDEDEQADGECLAYDDNGHGTAMVGLAGANDNSLPANDGVGIAPSASVYSMKVAFNADRPGLTCGLLPIGDDSFCVESDDLIAGIDWAADNGVDVLSMSFAGNPSVSVIAALSYAYNNDDVLLLASLGNDSGDPDGYVESPWVMGVGGVSDDTNRTYHVNLQHWEIGGYSGGLTTEADCPTSQDAICGIGGYRSSGGTSAATANVAAIATLVRAESPGLTNVQVRNRLKNTAYGRVYRLADAEWAVENVSPVSGTITGPTDITSEGIYSWQTTAAGGLGDYTYAWHKRTGNGSWRSIGSTSQISVWIAEGSSSFELRATVGSHGRERWVYRTVSVCWDEDDDCEQ